MPSKTMRASLLAVGCALSMAVFAQSGEPKALTIPAGSLADALRVLVAQSGAELIFEPSQVQGLRTPGLQGQMTVEDALQSLLDGTELRVQRDASGALWIVRTPPGNPRAQAGAAVELSQVLVTARKRDERRIDVPIAVSAISGEQLDAMGIGNVSDAVALAPGAAAFSTGGAFAYIQIRGASARQGSNENGYYLDEVPFNGVTVPWYPETRSFDIDRVEVLKGPQGTLFGEGSMGGTVRVITRKPEFNAFRASVEATASSTRGGDDSHGLKLMANIPLLEDRLAMRFGMTDEKLAGFLDRPDTGQTDVNEQRIQTGRAKLRFAPTERINIDLSYWKFKADSPGGFDQARDDFTVDWADDVYNEWDSSSLTASYDFDGSQLLYVFSDGGLKRNIYGYSPDEEIWIDNDIGVRTHELRWGSTGERRLDWTVGYYLRKASRRDHVLVVDWVPTSFSQVNDSFSIFGELGWKFTERWAATLGVRYFEDEVDASDVAIDAANVLQQKFSNTSPRVSLSYAPSDNAMWYVNAASGYRSGQLQTIRSVLLAQQWGIEVPIGIDPDRIWSYELGYKSMFDDGKVLLEAAVFYSDWDDMPVYIPLQGGSFSAAVNSAGSTALGVELGLTWLPSAAWAFQLGGSVIDSVYKEDLVGTQFFKGTPVFNVPKTQLAGSAAYNWPVGDNLKGIARTDVVYHSRRKTSPRADTPAGDAITRVSARIGLESPSGWAAYLFGENLLNEDGATDAYTPIQTATRLRPLTYGVELRFRY